MLGFAMPGGVGGHTPTLHNTDHHSPVQFSPGSALTPPPATTMEVSNRNIEEFGPVDTYLVPTLPTSSSNALTA